MIENFAANIQHQKKENSEINRRIYLKEHFLFFPYFFQVLDMGCHTPLQPQLLTFISREEGLLQMEL